MDTILINPLNYGSIVSALDKLEKFKSMLQNGVLSRFMYMLAQRADILLQGTAPPEAQGKWQITRTSKTNYDDNGYASSSYGFTIEFEGEVEFIEFGTGIVGEQNHAGINEEWRKKLPPPYTGYNKGPKIIHFDNPNLDFWWYYDNGFQKTQGQPANPFIYEAYKQLIEEIPSLFKEAFRVGVSDFDFESMEEWGDALLRNSSLGGEDPDIPFS